MNRLRVDESHFPFRRVDVDVHEIRRDFEKEHRDREATARQEVAIRLDEGMPQETIAYRPAIHEEIEPLTIWAGALRRGDKGVNPTAGKNLIDLDQGCGVVLGKNRGNSIAG